MVDLLELPPKLSPQLLVEGGERLVEQQDVVGEDGYMLPIASPQRAMEVFRAEFDAAHKYGGIWVAVRHPLVPGRMSRADAIGTLIEHMQAAGGVWFAPLDEIADHVRRVVSDGTWTPRVDRLPYWDRPMPGILSGTGVLPG